MNSTTTQRRLYAPACDRRWPFRQAHESLNDVLRRYRYGPKEGQTWGYNCRKITGGTGYSLHAYLGDGLFVFWNGTRITMAIAVDINSLANPYGPRLITDMPRQMVEEILAIRTNNGKQVWGWGGNYRNNKDAMHFEIVCDPADLATGIRRGVSAPPQQEEDEDMNIEYFTLLPGKDDEPGEQRHFAIEPESGFFGKTETLVTLECWPGSESQAWQWHSPNPNDHDGHVRVTLHRWSRRLAHGVYHVRNDGPAPIYGQLLVKKV